jgi:hypothetical protein
VPPIGMAGIGRKPIPECFFNDPYRLGKRDFETAAAAGAIW